MSTYESTYTDFDRKVSNRNETESGTECVFKKLTHRFGSFTFNKNQYKLTIRRFSLRFPGHVTFFFHYLKKFLSIFLIFFTKSNNSAIFKMVDKAKNQYLYTSDEVCEPKKERNSLIYIEN
jgi:hypothetical protein